MIICAIPREKGITSSHAWNIDGYKTKVRRKTVERYVNRELESTYTETERQDMVHCDLGWEGNCNGYYVSGVFHLASSQIEYDEGASYIPGNNFNYDRHLRLITCKKP